MSPLPASSDWSLLPSLDCSDLMALSCVDGGGGGGGCNGGDDAGSGGGGDCSDLARIFGNGSPSSSFSFSADWLECGRFLPPTCCSAIVSVSPSFMHISSEMGLIRYEMPADNCSVVDVTCGCCNDGADVMVELSNGLECVAIAVGGVVVVGINVIEPPDGGVGNALKHFGGVRCGLDVSTDVCKSVWVVDESSMLDIDEAGLNGLVSKCLAIFVTLLNALRGIDSFKSILFGRNDNESTG